MIGDTHICIKVAMHGQPMPKLVDWWIIGSGDEYGEHDSKCGGEWYVGRVMVMVGLLEVSAIHVSIKVGNICPCYYHNTVGSCGMWFW